MAKPINASVFMCVSGNKSFQQTADVLHGKMGCIEKHIDIMGTDNKKVTQVGIKSVRCVCGCVVSGTPV